MDAWKSSPEHDRDMRNKNFTEIGIGRAYNKSSKYGWYWTTTFGAGRLRGRRCGSGGVASLRG